MDYVELRGWTMFLVWDGDENKPIPMSDMNRLDLLAGFERERIPW